LTYPSDLTFGGNGEIYVAEAGGHTYGTKPDKAPKARILQVTPDGSTKVVYDKMVPPDTVRKFSSSAEMPEGIIQPITGLTFNPNNGLLYVSHRTRVSTLNPRTGEFNTIVNGLPSWGEFFNSKVIFGPDEKMYFALSTQGNSGTVDGHFIEVIKAWNKPHAREVPCEDVTLTGLDFRLDNKLTAQKGDKIQADVYVPLGVDTRPGQVIGGKFWCNGAVYRTDADGSNPERLAWGFRSIYDLGFTSNGRLIVTQNSGNIMQPRPVYDDWEPIYEVIPGRWYGWPDYYSSVPITDSRFRAPNDPEFKKKPFDHQFALTEETRRRLLKGQNRPPKPLVLLPIHSAAEGFTFGRKEFGIPDDEILVAEFGAIIPYYKDPEGWPGFRVQRVNLTTGQYADFMVNKSRKPAWATKGGGLRRPIQLEFGPDGALYVLDFGVVRFDKKGMQAEPNTGVIWKVTRSQ
jgi:glucose/arabinose dehydrogenase